MFVPLSTVTIGFVATNTTNGWNAIGSFFGFLFISAAACLMPVILAVLALKGGTKRKEKALLAVIVPLMALFIFFVSFGGLAE
jgi:hypothetical protein